MYFLLTNIFSQSGRARAKCGSSLAQCTARHVECKAILETTMQLFYRNTSDEPKRTAIYQNM